MAILALAPFRKVNGLVTKRCLSRIRPPPLKFSIPGDKRRKSPSKNSFTSISSWFDDFVREGSELFGGFGSKTAEEKDPGQVKGTKLKILKYPNPKLRQKNENITEFDDALLKTAEEMLLVMYASNGIGLAAPQVGINKRLMVFNEAGNPDKPDSEMILVNPVFLSKSDATDLKEEGCLSFPQIDGKVYRHTSIEVEYQTVTGEKIVKQFQDMPARIFQHEYDHLDQVLFIDRLVPEDKAINQKRLDKYVKKYGPGAAP